jgi:peptidoglycan/LPS O-acetylase OafA/YrhL
LVFFCLSGFVIIEAADSIYQKRPVAFMANRFIRVYPHFIVAVTLLIILQWWFAHQGTLHMERMNAVQVMPDFSWKNIILNYFCLLEPTEQFTNYEFVSIAWAVRIEVVFYAVVAICLLIAKLTKFRFRYTLAGACILFLPLFLMRVAGHGPATFGFFPYFVFGGALYYFLKGYSLSNLLIVAAMAITAHFLLQPWHHPTFGYLRNVPVQMVILLALISVFMWLAVYKGDFQRLDNRVGSITYPLYMYHLIPFIPVTALFQADYTYGAFIFGMLASLGFSVIMARIIDPIVDHYRDRVRGMRIAARDSHRMVRHDP